MRAYSHGLPVLHILAQILDLVLFHGQNLQVSQEIDGIRNDLITEEEGKRMSGLVQKQKNKNKTKNKVARNQL